MDDETGKGARQKDEPVLKAGSMRGAERRFRQSLLISTCINGLERESLPRQRTPVHFKLETNFCLITKCFLLLILYEEEKKNDPGRFGETVRNVCVTVIEKGKRGNDATVIKRRRSRILSYTMSTPWAGVAWRWCNTRPSSRKR